MVGDYFIMLSYHILILLRHRAHVTRVKELGPGDVVEEKPMTVDQDDSSVAQQNSALALLRTGNVSFFMLPSLSPCFSCMYVYLYCLTDFIDSHPFFDFLCLKNWCRNVCNTDESYNISLTQVR